MRRKVHDLCCDWTTQADFSEAACRCLSHGAAWGSCAPGKTAISVVCILSFGWLCFFFPEKSIGLQCNVITVLLKYNRSSCFWRGAHAYKGGKSYTVVDGGCTGDGSSAGNIRSLHKHSGYFASLQSIAPPEKTRSVRTSPNQASHCRMCVVLSPTCYHTTTMVRSGVVVAAATVCRTSCFLCLFSSRLTGMSSSVACIGTGNGRA